MTAPSVPHPVTPVTAADRVVDTRSPDPGAPDPGAAADGTAHTGSVDLLPAARAAAREVPAPVPLEPAAATERPGPDHVAVLATLVGVPGGDLLLVAGPEVLAVVAGAGGGQPAADPAAGSGDVDPSDADPIGSGPSTAGPSGTAPSGTSADVARDTLVAEALRPALEAAAAALGTGVLQAARVVPMSAAAEAELVALQHDGVTHAWFGARLSTAAPAAAAARTGMQVLYDVELDLTAELGRARLPMRDVLGLAPGTVIELDRAAGSPVDLLVNGRLVARGEVVVVDEDYGLRITEIVAGES